MKREPHSKYTKSIMDFKLVVTWNDGVIEDLTNDLHESLMLELEQHFVDLEDLKTQEEV